VHAVILKNVIHHLVETGLPGNWGHWHTTAPFSRPKNATVPTFCWQLALKDVSSTEVQSKYCESAALGNPNPLRLCNHSPTVLLTSQNLTPSIGAYLLEERSGKFHLDRFETTVT